VHVPIAAAAIGRETGLAGHWCRGALRCGNAKKLFCPHSCGALRTHAPALLHARATAIAESFLAGTSEVVSVSLYTTVPKMQRLDIWPFAIVWGIYIAATLVYGVIHSTELHLLCGGLIGVLQALTMLCSQWSVAMRCVLQCRRVSAHATSCAGATPCASSLAPRSCLLPPRCGRAAHAACCPMTTAASVLARPPRASLAAGRDPEPGHPRPRHAGDTCRPGGSRGAAEGGGTAACLLPHVAPTAAPVSNICAVCKQPAAPNAPLAQPPTHPPARFDSPFLCP